MNPLPLAKPFLDEDEINRVSQVIASGWVTQGPVVGEFEKAFARATGASHAVAVSNCTAALHLGLLAVGVGPGDVVITVSHSFIASANAVRLCGAEPFFVDVEPGTGNMAPKAFARALETEFEDKGGALWLKNPKRLARETSPLVRCAPPIGRLGAVMPVHQVGMPADMARLLEIARAAGIPVVEDAACAVGSALSLDRGGSWEPVGRPHGDVACFSFHPRKVLTTGEGGMLTCATEEAAQKCRLFRHHGMGVSDLERHAAGEVVFESYLETGANYRMTDMQAAMGLAQLEKLAAMLEKRRELVRVYRELLSDIPGLGLPVEPEYARTNWQSFAVRVDSAQMQRPLMQALQDRGISTRRGVMCAHLEAPYRKLWPPEALPESTAARDTGIMLPLFHGMDPDDCARVAQALREFLG